MPDLVPNQNNVYIVTVSPTPSQVVVMPQSAASVVIDNSRIGPQGPAGPGADEAALHAYSDTAALEAYTNAIAYVDNQSFANTSDVTTNAAAAYTNALSVVAAQSYANTEQVTSNAAAAYSNAVSDAAALASNAYANAIAAVPSLAANSASYLISPVTTVTSDYTVLANDSLLIGNSTFNVTLTLPPAASVIGKSYDVKNINTGRITIVGSGSDVIDGYANLIIQYKNSMLSVRAANSSYWVAY
jgi:hypothetical protein